MNTVFPARESPVTPRRIEGLAKFAAKSRTPPMAMRVSSKMLVMLTGRDVGRVGGKSKGQALRG